MRMAAHPLAVDRTHLAYKRTMLSWVRTATALITFGFSIQQFFRITKGESPEKLAMIVIGLVALLLATWGHRVARAVSLSRPVADLTNFALERLDLFLQLVDLLRGARSRLRAGRSRREYRGAREAGQLPTMPEHCKFS
jgi:Domain of unknown function (DUF202)